MTTNYAFERLVMRFASARVQRTRHHAPSGRLERLRPAAQCER